MQRSARAHHGLDNDEWREQCACQGAASIVVSTLCQELLGRILAHLLCDWRFVLAQTAGGVYFNPAGVCKVFCAAVKRWVMSRTDLQDASSAYTSAFRMPVPYDVQGGDAAFQYRQYRWVMHRANTMGMMIQHNICPLDAIMQMTEWVQHTDNKRFSKHVHDPKFEYLREQQSGVVQRNDEQCRRECHKWLVMLLHRIEMAVCDETTGKWKQQSFLLQNSVHGAALCMNALRFDNETPSIQGLARQVVVTLHQAKLDFLETCERCNRSANILLRISDDDKRRVCYAFSCQIERVSARLPFWIPCTFPPI